MNANEPTPSIEEKIRRAISSGTVAMKPRWHFVLAAVLCALGTVIVALTLIFVSSLLVFAMRRSGALFGPQFGLRGWFVFAMALPWVVIGVGIIFVIVLEILVRRYAFSYRRPLLFTLGAIGILVIAGSYALERFSFQRRMMRFADRAHLPFAGDMYHGFERMRFGSVSRGRIVATTTDGFFLQIVDGSRVRVVITPGSRLPLGAVEIGQPAVVFGDISHGVIPAFGVRFVEEE